MGTIAIGALEIGSLLIGGLGAIVLPKIFTTKTTAGPSPATIDEVEAAAIAKIKELCAEARRCCASPD